MNDLRFLYELLGTCGFTERPFMSMTPMVELRSARAQRMGTVYLRTGSLWVSPERVKAG
jgi:hypothetical protein